jgi:cytosine/adenosine deaminase-related metal-dependent hydrolase
MRLVIKGGRIIDPRNGLDTVGDLLVEDGVIAWCGQHLPDAMALDGDVVFDASGLIVAPGLIDMHVHQGDHREWRPGGGCGGIYGGGPDAEHEPGDGQPGDGGVRGPPGP